MCWQNHRGSDSVKKRPGARPWDLGGRLIEGLPAPDTGFDPGFDIHNITADVLSDRLRATNNELSEVRQELAKARVASETSPGDKFEQLGAGLEYQHVRCIHAKLFEDVCEQHSQAQAQVKTRGQCAVNLIQSRQALQLLANFLL